MSRRRLVVLAGLLCLSTAAAANPSPQQEASRMLRLLGDMHPDHGRYIRAVRPARSGLAPANLYLGLVRPGGDDPRRPEDAPEPGPDHRYDLIVFAGGPPLAAEEAWSRLLVDHEFFHARRLAHGDAAPHPAFGVRAADRHLHEALAWEYNLRRAASGAYGALAEDRRQEAARRYREHRDALRAFIVGREPQAWAYYERLLPD